MPPKTLAKGRYPKRKRAEIDYDVDKSFVDVPDLDDDGYFSEELGEDSTISASSYFPAAAASAPQTNTITVVEVDSEYEDATFGSRKKIKKRKVVTKLKARAQPKPKPPPKFMPFRLMDLPAELRLKVYEEALVDPHGVTIRSYSDKWESFPAHVSVSNIRSPYYLTPKWYVRGKWTTVPDNELPKKKNRLSPNLLAASKTVHAETVSLLWTQPFLFTDVQGLHAFLLMLKPETISRLRDITILQHGWTNHKILPAFVLLRHAPLRSTWPSCDVYVCGELHS
ncbi:hypothetical protein F5883DRAFT_207661 [Diaporthe sp. PMI_573]|nr:hypothetical protein F5883DRAFT_207661 [Diaporthaceae sp. PMI_573]